MVRVIATRSCQGKKDKQASYMYMTHFVGQQGRSLEVMHSAW